MKNFLIVLLIMWLPSKAQEIKTDSLTASKSFPFIIKDSPSPFFTMRFVNQNYLSSYRLFSRFIDNKVNKKRPRNLIKMGSLILFMPITHEEGHRSILTSKNIGSISAPYFTSKGTADVKGVSDSTLIFLRGNDFPTFIRLHTAGLESDYLLTTEEEALISFEMETMDNLELEYVLRKSQIVFYYLTGLFKYDVKITEDKDEKRNDIVGHDIYGAVRHLHRPAMEFYRYTRYDSLTTIEKKYIKRCGWLSLLNFVSPVMLGKENFKLTDNLKFNFSLGYTLSPFGDYTDQNVYIKYRNSLNLQFYIREYYNKQSTFPAFGISIVNFPINKNKVYINFATHIWNQPQNLLFTSTNSFWGGAVDCTIKWPFFLKGQGKMDAMSIDLGAIYKTKGFLPGEVMMGEHFGFRFGTTIYY